MTSPALDDYVEYAPAQSSGLPGAAAAAAGAARGGAAPAAAASSATPNPSTSRGKRQASGSAAGGTSAAAASPSSATSGAAAPTEVKKPKAKVPGVLVTALKLARLLTRQLAADDDGSSSSSSTPPSSSAGPEGAPAKSLELLSTSLKLVVLARELFVEPEAGPAERAAVLEAQVGCHSSA